MALQSIKRPSTRKHGPSAPPQALNAGTFVSRISPADELQLACRLAECRRELLVIALLAKENGIDLLRVSSEVASGARRANDVLEGAVRTADESRAALDHYAARVLELQAEVSPVLLAAPEQIELGAAEREALDAVSRRMLELVKSQPLASDMVDRLLQQGWSCAPGPAARLLRARVRRLEGEIETIRSRFIHANQGLVSYVVQRYRNMGLRREDLMQEGNIGLLRAIEKFDHRRGTRFSVYAVWWIRQAVRRALANQSRTIRIPVHALAVRYAVDQASKRLSLELGREPSEQELASATGVVPTGVAQVLGMVKEPLSLDAPRGPDSDASLGESVADRAAVSPNEHAARNERADRLHGLLDGLSEREQQMLRMRFGLDGADECTLEQIGQSFALTRERVRQIVTAALDKLHHQTQIRRMELEPTLD
jgi:RNA polymerase sigma factor (sigma-70 family)